MDVIKVEHKSSCTPKRNRNIQGGMFVPSKGTRKSHCKKSPLERKGFLMLTTALKRLLFLCGTLVLVSCGVTSTDPSGAAASSGSTNTSPPVVSSKGPISFSINHSVYAPTDGVKITLTNLLTQTIYAFDHQASCSILSLQIEQQGTWMALTTANPDLAKCPLSTPTRLVAISPNGSYNATIIAGFLHQGDRQFAVGTYRLAFSYTITSNNPVATNFVTVYSDPFAISGSVTPEPTASAPVAPSQGTPQP
jgi:hypothetical protein